MKKPLLLLSSVLASVLSVSAADAWVDLFDGKTLDGWTELNGTASYKVVDGTITGTTAEGSPNSFLCSNKLFGNFELEFEVKVDDALNSGLQIRSAQKTGADVQADGAGNKKTEIVGRVFGPQVEIEASPGQSGWIYGEAMGGGWLSPEPKEKDPAKNQNSFLKNGEWNTYRVIANGPRIRTFINGNPVADLTDEAVYKAHPKGFFGLQVHAIKPGTGPYSVSWRNIRIKELPATN